MGPVRPGLLEGDDSPHDHEHGAEDNDGLVERDLRQEPPLGAQPLQEADV